MIFKKLKISNFMIVKEASLDFLSGLTLIEGVNRDSAGASSNFSGKSSVIEALVWCLFGKTVRKMSVGDVINNTAKEACEVSVEFSVGDDDYTITRTRYAGKYGIKKLIIIHNGTDITPSDKQQSKIDEILDMDYDVFMHSCVFAHNAQFNFIQMTNAGQKAVIEKIIDCEGRFDSYLKKVKHRISTLVDKSNIEEEKKTRSSERIDVLNKERYRIDKWLGEARLKNKEKSNVKESLSSLKKAYRKVREKEEQIRQKQNKNAEVLSKITGRLSGLVGKIADLQDTDVLKKGECPTCGQKVSAVLAKKFVEDFESELDLTLDDSETLITKQRRRRKTDAKYQREALALLADMTEIGDKIERKQDSEVVDTSKYEERLVDIDEEIKQEREAITYAKQEQIKLQRRGEYYSYLEEAFSRDGIESYLFDSLLPFLNERANHYADKLSGGRISVNFATIKETQAKNLKDEFHVCVSAVDGAESYGGCSSSEERWADLAVALAKRDLVEASGRILPGILLLDEIFDSVDDVGAARALEFLLEYAADKTVWLISHNNELTKFFDRKIVVTREGGVANVSQRS